MNPSIEVQITARLDKLDAGLRLAEAKVMSSTANMGKAGDSAGSAYSGKLLGGIAKSLGPMAIASALGGILMDLAKGINAKDSGGIIAEDILTGLHDKAKNLPIVGILFSAFDELINGAERLGIEAGKKFTDAIEKQISSTKIQMDALKNLRSDTDDILARVSAGKDPTKLLTIEEDKSSVEDAKVVNNAREAEEQRFRDRIGSIRAKHKEIELTAPREFSTKKLNEDLEKAKKQHLEKMREIDDAYANLESARDKEHFAKLKTIADEAAKQDADALQKARDVAKKAQDDAVKKQEEAQKKELDRALQAQQDIIDANEKAQDEIDKVGRLDRMAQDAGQGLISSGQTALGQFNFAQDGASGQALALAQKQVTALEAIEKATAEQVRLTKGGQEFR